MLTTFIKGSQINIQPAVIIDEQDVQVSYKQIYFVENSKRGDDQNDQFTNLTQQTICQPNPCKNGGLCFVGFMNTFVCMCSRDYTGIFIYQIF